MMKKFHSSQILPSHSLSELLLYCQRYQQMKMLKYCFILKISRNFRELLDYMICDGLDEIVINGFDNIEENAKPKILLSWITYSSAIFNSTQQKSIDDILMKVYTN